MIKDFYRIYFLGARAGFCYNLLPCFGCAQQPAKGFTRQSLARCYLKIKHKHTDCSVRDASENPLRTLSEVEVEVKIEAGSPVRFSRTRPKTKKEISRGNRIRMAICIYS
jgi:hypothetical protein